ncbi:MAG TPA: threonine--tRNA ligase [Candidatus Saccharimonadia bacterium]|nr:threonine--tRNA ligase [Candidatus Saccharimonadia bacterium]
MNQHEPQAEQLYAMRHSLAHIMATAIQELYPQAKFGIGPVVEHGFYYDVDLPERLGEDDLAKIESKMHQVIAANYKFVHSHLSLDEAIKHFKAKHQTYKLDLLEDLKKHGTTVAKDIDRTALGVDDGAKVDRVSIYTDGPFMDLCRGPHLESTGQVGAFKLMRVSGAYWRGDEKNAQLQRIYGVGFTTKDELKAHLHMLEEAQKRDHKILGPKMELFFFHETAPGMPYWLPNGVVLYNELINFWRAEHIARGYGEIMSPLLNKKELYVTSGHYAHYWDEMFTSTTQDEEQYGMKAMNCPNAMIVYKSKLRSYRELPLRLADTDTLHRFERSGALNGLFRVREFRQDDAHIFVSADQIKDEYLRVFDIVERFYSIFGMEYSFRLGTRPEKFMGKIETWDKAEAALKEILESSGRDYFIEEGDGAFYGPKIDILMKDCLGRPWQMGTIQLDFQQPQNFELKYTDKDGQEKAPVAIHRVIYGSMERFIGILIEHLAGQFPLWLAPEQVRLAPINDTKEITEYTEKLRVELSLIGLRVGVDGTAESVGKKIRAAGLAKVPYTLVIGEKERETGRVSPRLRTGHGEFAGELSANEFAAALQREVAERAPRSVL